MYTLLVPSRIWETCAKRALGTKVTLSKGGKSKVFNLTLMNKLMRIEWMNEWVQKPMAWLRHPWAKNHSETSLQEKLGRKLFVTRPKKCGNRLLNKRVLPESRNQCVQSMSCANEYATTTIESINEDRHHWCLKLMSSQSYNIQSRSCRPQI